MEKNRSAIVDPILREIHRLKPTLKDEQIHILSPRFLAGDEETPFIYFPGNPPAGQYLSVLAFYPVRHDSPAPQGLGPNPGSKPARIRRRADLTISGHGRRHAPSGRAASEGRNKIIVYLMH